MSVNKRNLVRYSGTGGYDPTNAVFGPQADGLYLLEPEGLLDGSVFGVRPAQLFSAATGWIITEVGTSGAKAIQAATATLPPFARFTTGTTQHDNIQIQQAIDTVTYGGAVSAVAHAPFICKANYNIHFGCRVQLTTTVANAAVLLGIGTIDTTSLASSAITNDDFVGFYKAASGTMGGVVRNGGTSTTQALTVGGTSGWTPTVSTWYDLEFLVEGRTQVTFFVNGEATTQQTMTNLPANTEVLALTAAVSAGTAAAATLEIQSIYCYQEGS